MSTLVCERSGGIYCHHKILFSSVGMIFLMLMATLKNFKQLSLISYIANFTVILALVAICIDGTYIITFRTSVPEIKYFDFNRFP